MGTRRATLLWVRVFLLACGCSAAGPAQAARWLIPASAHAEGANNTRFRTDVMIANPGFTAAAVSIWFLPAGADNSVLPSPVTRTVAAGTELDLGDVVDTLFGRSGGGALLLESAAGLVITSRTYNQLSDRTFGMFLPGLPVTSALAPGETGHMIFLAKSEVYRTNVGFAGTTATAGTATVKLFGGGGELLGTTTTEVKGYGQIQINDVFAQAGAAATTVARAEVTATVPVFAYATVIDNRTGDPFPLIAEKVNPLAFALMLTASAHAPGANGSDFRSDLRVYNTAATAATLTLVFYPRGATATSPDVKQVELAAGQLLALDDVLLTAFGKEGAAGAILLSANQPILAMSRTYNLAPDGSTSGQELPAVNFVDYARAGDTLRLPGISNRNARANLLFVNQTQQPAEVTVRFYGATAAADRSPLLLGQGTVTLPPQSMSQVDRIHDVLGLPAGSSGFLTLTSESSLWWVVATVIDGVSNDPGQVSPDVERAGAPGSCVTMTFAPPTKKYTYEARTNNVLDQTFDTVWEVASVEQTRRRYHIVTPVGEVIDQVITIFRNQIPGSPHHVEVPRLELSGTSSTRGAFSRLLTNNPAQVTGPTDIFCVGDTWNAPSVTVTILDTPGGQTQGPTVPSKGQVLSTNDRVTAAGVTWRTVRTLETFTLANRSTYTQELWISITDGTIVKEVVSGLGNSTTTLLTNVQPVPALAPELIP